MYVCIYIYIYVYIYIYIERERERQRLFNVICLSDCSPTQCQAICETLVIRHLGMPVRSPTLVRTRLKRTRGHRGLVDESEHTEL